MHLHQVGDRRDAEALVGGRFMALAGGAPAGPRLMDGIAAAHREDGRHYHDLRHVAEMVTLLDDLAEGLDDGEAVFYACCYHDIVYVPLRIDNEELSAHRCRRDLDLLGRPPVQIEHASRLILATKDHRSRAGGRDEALFIDADLAILGAPRERYREYMDGVRREYWQVDDAAYRAGRCAVLRRLLARGPLYQTETMAARFDAAARENIQFELNLLAC